MRASASFRFARARVAAACVAAALASSAAVADARLCCAEGAHVTFEAVGPAGLTIHGRTADLRASEDDAGVVHVIVGLASLDTGIALRNRHMREKYLQTDRYPVAELTVPRAALTFPAPGGSSTGSAGGTMTIHGVSKPVLVRYATKREGQTYFVTGSVPLSMKDFGIDVPSYMGLTVKPNVAVTASFALTDR